MHGKKADLFTLGIEIIHGFAGCLTDGAHGDDDALGILRAMIVEEVVLAARDLREIRHGFLYKLRQRLVILVGGFLRLEVDVRVLRRAADDRMIRVQCACTAQNPDIYFQSQEAANKYYEALPELVEEAMADLAKITGREHTAASGQLK